MVLHVTVMLVNRHIHFLTFIYNTVFINYQMPNKKKPHWVKLYLIVLFIEWKESGNESEEHLAVRR